MANDESPFIESFSELEDALRVGEKPRAAWRIGTEQEKCGVREDGTPVPFTGPRGVSALLASLAERYGWTGEREHAGGEVIALRRGEASITLEPGIQLELSGAPLRTIHETHAEIEDHLSEVVEASRPLGIVWLGLGFHPFARREDFEWLPKLRYGVMREYFPTRGGHGIDMMLRTSTVQANLDYASEADAMRKLRAALRLSPIVTAMFANSPFVEGRPTGGRSFRARVWLDVDPDRSGLLPFAWDDRELSYARYVEWALDVPMFLIKREGQVVKNTGQTFRAFLKDGFSGHRATREDWTTHLNTLFPEARLKRTLEVRGADSTPRALVVTLPALYKGLFYDETALGQLESLLSKLAHDEVEAARPAIAERALRASMAGRELAAWAGDVLEIAEAGLARIADRDSDGRDESIYLAPLRALVERGDSPADVLLREVDPADLTASIIARTRLG